MATTANLVFFILTLPILFYSSWTDLKFMRITNKANLLLFAIFLVLGLFFFPLQEFGTRLLQGAGMLLIGVFLTGVGVMGGGDSKLLAASAPFVALTHAPAFLMLLAIWSFAAVFAHRGLGMIPAFKKSVKGWDSWGETRNFPFGVPIAATLATYLILHAGIV